MKVSVLKRLFKEKFAKPPLSVKALPLSGSARRYFRLSNGDISAIGTFNPDIRENIAFLEFSRHFLNKGLSVPEIFLVSEDKLYYLQQDLGDITLYDYANKVRHGSEIPAELKNIYYNALKELIRFQIYGHEGLNYDVCTPRYVFDQQSMLWDLNYFKSFFLKMSGLPFDEQQLETDFLNFTNYLDAINKENFLYRDFQSRNILINNKRLFFIDYQGGRRGAMQYDVASFLFEAKTDLPADFREELLDYYLDELSVLINIDRDIFRTHFYPFALIRVLQALGAYGFRGLVEKKAVFLQSIPLALKNLKYLIDKTGSSVKLPELKRISEEFTFVKKFDLQIPSVPNVLTIRVFSFSYLKGIPDDLTGHGGGFVFDCRGIHNPGRYPEYSEMTGKDPEVEKFFEKKSEMKAFVKDVYSILNRHIDFYLKSKYLHMQVNFGCTGGIHRSVYAAERIAELLKQRKDVKVILRHMES